MLDSQCLIIVKLLLMVLGVVQAIMVVLIRRWFKIGPMTQHAKIRIDGQRKHNNNRKNHYVGRIYAQLLVPGVFSCN